MISAFGLISSALFLTAAVFGAGWYIVRVPEPELQPQPVADIVTMALGLFTSMDGWELDGMAMAHRAGMAITDAIPPLNSGSLYANAYQSPGWHNVRMNVGKPDSFVSITLNDTEKRALHGAMQRLRDMVADAARAKAGRELAKGLATETWIVGEPSNEGIGG